ncbi:uncharacterized protein K452DRAFT_47293 [Aplosporella prunicola CBS 121167]|uniref:Uncharacterized protein n=1 Tax=Aplosporella prunicola CBS 121167 TaxID=1176127 RepID=A0A6A6BC47_9PEZI|nr:uncharacterized protein K452DRAFT_47293 [Aplosporella prunicola CBS 121167]KAF2140487.1 hypothetical protein K452DRAFT_47293 [Aplosporella prunicola CBS 121167]
MGNTGWEWGVFLFLSPPALPPSLLLLARRKAWWRLVERFGLWLRARLVTVKVAVKVTDTDTPSSWPNQWRKGSYVERAQRRRTQRVGTAQCNAMQCDAMRCDTGGARACGYGALYM